MGNLLLFAAISLLTIGAASSRSSHHVKAPASLNMQQEFISSIRDSGRMKRKIYQFEMHGHKQWTLPVKYMIHSSLWQVRDRGSTATQLIERVMREDFEANTCIRFERVISEPDQSEQYIRFERSTSANSCTAKVGMEENTQTIHGQPIYLGEDCFRLRKAIIYTIASTLGLLNEMNRPDRDQYVDIERENVEPTDLFNFARHSSDYFDTLDLPYDYGSIMHSRPNRGLRDDVSDRNETALTVVPRDRRMLYVPGQYSEISFYDLLAINSAYCSDTCQPSIPPVTCQNGGYRDPLQCSRCRCPDGFGGNDCGRIIDGDSGCTPSSGRLVAQEQITCLQSPNFESTPRRYATGSECAWMISAPPGRLIDLWFEELDLPSLSMSVYATCLHWVEIKQQGMQQIRGIRYCEDVNRNRLTPGFLPEAVVPMQAGNNMTSEASDVHVIFKSPDYFETAGSDDERGFQLCFRISDKILTTTTLTDIVTSPAAVAIKADDNDDDDTDKLLLYIGSAVGVLLLILIFSICFCIVVTITSKKRRTQPSNTSTLANSQVSMVHTGDFSFDDSSFHGGGGKKHVSFDYDDEGIDSPSMKDIEALPRYVETELPPKYGYSCGSDDGDDERMNDVIHQADTLKLTDLPYATAKTAL